MRKLAVAALTVTLAGPSLAAAADFEGIIDAKMTMAAKTKSEEGGSGTIRLYVSGAGARMEMQMVSPMGEIKMTSLHLKATPGKSYMINDEKKTYAEVSHHASNDKDDAREEKATVKKLPNERVAGYDCAHALITDAQGEQTEVWISKALGGAESFWAAQAGEESRGGKKMKERIKLLRDNGLDGWPLKFKSYQKKGELTWETVKVDKRSVPGSKLSLSGYTKTEGMGGMGQVKLAPEQQKKMEEAQKQMQESMKKMTPEQRKQMEEMMKQFQGGNPGK